MGKIDKGAAKRAKFWWNQVRPKALEYFEVASEDMAITTESYRRIRDYIALEDFDNRAGAVINEKND